MPVGTPVRPHLAIRAPLEHEPRRPGVSLALHGRRRLTIPFRLCRPSARRAAAAAARGRMRRNSRSTSRCRRCASPAANRSTAKASAPHAGPNCRSSRRRFARGSAFPLSTIPAPDLLSMEAIANPPAYARARAAVRYDDVARTLVHALKYQDRTDLAPAMGRWMARAGRELLGEADALVPVPLHWRRGWSRRYNQSGALARAIERQTGVKVASEALRRVRPTQQQIGLSRPQRASNVQGAFKVAADRQSRYCGAPRGSGRRCPDLRGHGRRLRAGAVARQGRFGRRAGIRAGCGHP